MITSELFHPSSISIIGASNNLRKPGGKIYYNIKAGSFKGELYGVNPKENQIQGDKCYSDIAELPYTDMAILAIPAAFCVDSVKKLAEEKKTKAFIIISAGFSEEDETGAKVEEEITSICNKHGASLIGPNCIGVMTPEYQGVFTLPIPKLDPSGCDFISGSGATAVFIMEAGLQKGLKFNNVFSVGNSAQNGVEDVLAYLDENFQPGQSTPVKILYFESIKNPAKLLKHASSLKQKGCSIAAIKAGTSEAGSRAASSHTGAMATSDVAVDALFRKAGIVRCYGREELTTVASVMLYGKNIGKNYAIITHAGGPAVMLTDALAEGNLKVPQLTGEFANELLDHLFPGSSAANPIDILATGNAGHVKLCLEYCEKKFDEIDSVVLIFGTPGLAPVFDVYEVLHEHMLNSEKPVYPVLPSVTTASDEVHKFLSYGHMNFPDEVQLGQALVKINQTSDLSEEVTFVEGIDMDQIRKLLHASGEGYLSPANVRSLLEATGINTARELINNDAQLLSKQAEDIGYPLVMKVVGPLHKTDVGGVKLNIRNESQLKETYEQMRQIEDFQGVLLQPMLQGTELFAGAKYEKGYGHIIMCGLGGIFVETLRDITTSLGPIGYKEAHSMVCALRSYDLLKGARGQEAVAIDKFEDILVRLSVMLSKCPEIYEMDLNPLIAEKERVTVVDARIRIKK